MMLKRLPLLALSVLIILCVGCDADPDTPVGFASGLDAGASGPALFERDPTMAYPVCHVPDYHRCPPVDERGSRGGYGFSPEGGCWQACQCRYTCENHADCPRPFTGSVSPQCFHGTCVLPCGEGYVCPNGMRCVEDETRDVRWCMWVSETRACAD